MDSNIKKESINPSESDIKNISEKSSNETIKKQIVDDRYDAEYMSNRKTNDKIKPRRPIYPWEDASIFERDESEENIKIIKENYTSNNKEEKYTANTQNLEKKNKVKYKSEPDKFVTVKMQAVINLAKAKPINKIIVIDGGGTRTYTPPDGNIQGKYYGNKQDVQIRVVQLLKAHGLSLEQTAGIMGNMQAENSKWTPDRGIIDSNNRPAVGLVMFNANTYVGAKTIEGMFAVIPKDVDGQMNYLFNTRKFKKFLEVSKGETNHQVNGFLFAKFFEGCKSCISEVRYYKSDRPGYAKGFYEQLKNPSSPLYWGKIESAKPGESVGSGEDFIYKTSPSSIRFYSKGNGRWSVKDLITEGMAKFGKKNAVNLSFYDPYGKWDSPYKDDVFADYKWKNVHSLFWIDSTGAHIKQFNPEKEEAPKYAKYIVAGKPIAILDGKPQYQSWWDTGRSKDPTERTAVCITYDGNVIIYVAKSKTLTQGRDSMMKINGVKDAIFLDGGSSTFLMKDGKFLIRGFGMRTLPNILMW